MVKVKTRYLAMLRDLVGLREEVVDVPEHSTLLDFLKKLAERHELLKKTLFDERGELREGFTVAHNASTVPRRELEVRMLREGDEVVVLPPISGGLI